MLDRLAGIGGLTTKYVAACVLLEGHDWEEE